MQRHAWATSQRLLGLAMVATLLGLAPRLCWSHPGIDEAEDVVAHALEKSPRDPALYLQRAMLERERRDWDAAAASYTTAAELGADRDVTDVALATVFSEAGLQKTALARVNLALDRDPDNAVAVFARARIHAQGSEHAAAAADYARAVALLEHPEPGLVLEAMTAQLIVEQPDAVVSEGGMAADGGATNAESDATKAQRISSALAVADAAMAKLGVVATIQSRAIELETELERYSSAIARIDTMLAQAPRHEVWIAQRGDLLLAYGKPEEAVQSYTRALALINERPSGRRSPKLSSLEAELQKKLANHHDPGKGENP
jgi:tetratricopeptide (TPR) repeat protein